MNEDLALNIALAHYASKIDKFDANDGKLTRHCELAFTVRLARQQAERLFFDGPGSLDRIGDTWRKLELAREYRNHTVALSNLYDRVNLWACTIDKLVMKPVSRDDTDLVMTLRVTTADPEDDEATLYRLLGSSVELVISPEVSRGPAAEIPSFDLAHDPVSDETEHEADEQGAE